MDENQIQFWFFQQLWNLYKTEKLNNILTCFHIYHFLNVNKEIIDMMVVLSSIVPIHVWVAPICLHIALFELFLRF